MREFSTHSRFPCGPDEYYALVLNGPFQQQLHVDGLGMEKWDYTDSPPLDDDGTMKRVVFSEPRLNLPYVIANIARFLMIGKAQAYHEHATFVPSERRRLVRLVPCVGSERIDFTFDEWVRPDFEAEDDGDGNATGGGCGCVVEATVRVSVGGGVSSSSSRGKAGDRGSSNWLCRALERFIASTAMVNESTLYDVAWGGTCGCCWRCIVLQVIMPAFGE